MTKKKIETEEIKPSDCQHCFEDLAVICISTPMGDPRDPDTVLGLPAMFWGLSGVGKTKRTEQVCRALGLPIEWLCLGTKMPEDLSGTPCPKPGGGLTIECTLSAIRTFVYEGIDNGVLFLDEANQADDAVQGAMLGLFLERRIGDTKLPRGIRILLASNPPEYSAGGKALTAPMANRMAHFWVGCSSVEEWEAYKMNGPKQLLCAHDTATIVMAAWPRHYGAELTSCISFLKTRRDLFQDQPKPGTDAEGYGWPSPRVWDMLIWALTTRRCLGLPATLDAYLIEGLVGIPAAKEYIAWRAAADLPSPEDVLAQKWKPDTVRLDRTYSAYYGAVRYVLDTRDKQEQLRLAAQAWLALHQLTKELADIAAGCARLLAEARLGMSCSSSEVRAAAQVLMSRL